MTDKDIHKGLKHEAIRNAITDTLNNTLSGRLKVEDIPYPQTDSRIEMTVYRINKIRNDIKSREHDIKLEEQTLAMYTLMDLKGYEEFDVSDHVEKDQSTILYRCFIGTKEEYEKFMSDNNFDIDEILMNS